MKGENSFKVADEPVTKSGTSDHEIPISLAVFHFLNAKLKWVYLIFIAGTIGRRNNPQITWAVVGVVSSACISKALKVLLNQKRPNSALGIRTDPGMPSSHAYIHLYTTAYVTLALIGGKGLNITTFGMGLAIIAVGAFAAWFRVVEGLHTRLQVMVGIMLGFITAITWYYTWNTIIVTHLLFFNRVRLYLHLASLIISLNL